jgi:DNA-binding beta-propeller fold protein YncE
LRLPPDGATAGVTNELDTTVRPITAVTNTAGIPITVGNNPRGIAITPTTPTPTPTPSMFPFSGFSQPVDNGRGTGTKFGVSGYLRW